ncbi:MAG: glycosyltransferase family 4 protein [Algoriphagus sp.]|uniref:glycosyltransferase family 4 protein n=1 Tax=Algoriphagus sp. TaxID=1872435 RepID=UPI00182AFBE0|nr:glycosyltransferase family 4 protein [Algoriphagus sp.]NVJ86753.1 glycosyltransferase family 4 protein [Algoriphagus sp.]
MYPSDLHPNYGVFVRNFERDFPDKSIRITDKTVISGKSNGFKRLINYLRFFFDSVQKLRQENFDLVYVHFLQHSLIPLHFWKNKSGKKIVLNAHGTDILGQGILYRLLRKWNLSIFRKADLVVVPSEYFVPKLEQFGVPTNRIEISPSGGINPQLFFPDLNSRNQLKNRIGYLGRIDKGKGVETLIRAFTQVPIENLQLELAGPGAMIEELKSLSQSLEVYDRIQFLGNIPQEKIREIFARWDVFIFPSELDESLGLVGLEAMACGLPVIGSGKGGMSTYLLDGENGIVFEPGDVIDLSKKILDFYVQNQEFRLNLSTRAIAAANRYQADRVNSKLRKRIQSFFHS